MVYGVLDYSNPFLKDKQYKQKTSPESYKSFAHPGLAESTLNNPDPPPRGRTFGTIRHSSAVKGRGGGAGRERGGGGCYHAGCIIIRKRLGSGY